MSLAIRAFAPEPLFTRRAHRQNMARAAKAFSAISLGAAFVLTTGEAGAQSSRASAEEGFPQSTVRLSALTTMAT